MWRQLIAGALLAAWLTAASATASIVIGQHDWNDGSLEGWTEDQDWVTLSNPGSGGVNDSGYLRISLAATDTLSGDPGAEWFALTHVPADSLFAGNWSPGMWTEFDFWAGDVAPEYVQVRWQSSTNSAVWRSTVFDSNTATLPISTWTSMDAPNFTSYVDWDHGSGSQEQFVSDLSSIDWIGVYIWRNTADEQEFGLDDFRVLVPEPGEYMMLASACVTAAFTLRRRRKHAQVLSRQS